MPSTPLDSGINYNLPGARTTSYASIDTSKSNKRYKDPLQPIKVRTGLESGRGGNDRPNTGWLYPRITK